MTDRFDQHPQVENVGAWLLGALDDDEARAFAAELERSEDLRAEVERLRTTSDALLMGAEQHLAPPDLGARVLATVREEAALRRAAEGRDAPAAVPARAPQRRWSWLRLHRGLAAGLAAAVIAVLVAGGVLVSGGSNGSVGTTTVHAQVATPGGSGVLVVDGSAGAQLAVSGVPDPGPGRTYEVWHMPKGSTTPQRSTLFITGADGSASVHIPGELRKGDKILVTNEPAGGSAQPTNTNFVVQAVV